MTSSPSSRLPMLYPVLLVSFSPLGIDLLLPAANVITASFAVPPERAGLLISAFLLPLGLGQIPFGRLSDRIGRRSVALIGLAVFGGGSLLGALSTGWSMLLAARIIQGIGASATTVVAFAAVRDRSEAGAAGGFAILTAVLNTVTALAPVLGLAPLLILGWRAVFWLYLGLGVAALAVIRYMPESTGSVATKLTFRAILSRRQAALPALVTILAMIFIMGQVSIAPVILIERLGLSEVAFGGLFTLNAVVVVAAAATVAPLTARIGAGRLAVIGLALFALSGTWLLAASRGGDLGTPVPWIGAIALGSIGFAYAFGPGQGLALAPFGTAAGAASGLLGAAQLSVAAVATGGLSAVGATAGLFGVALLAIAIPILAACLVIGFTPGVETKSGGR